MSAHLTPTVDLIVLAGGRGSRLGGALKPAVEVAGRTLLSRVLDASPLARRVVVVGPPAARPAAGAPPLPEPDSPPDHTSSAPDDHTAATPSALIWALEDPPFGGPVAGLAAGLAALTSTSGTAGTDQPKLREPASWLLVLACDLPWGADAAHLLVAAASACDTPTLAATGTAPTVDGVHLVDDTGHAQWLAGIYRAPALQAAVDRLGDHVAGASMRQLLAGLTLLGVLDESGAGVDVDTWQDVESSTARLSAAPEAPPEE
ncbi:molybdenum cofactor guanylyltransferase [Cryobacterium sp. Y11]|uniref:molybdenum cofactor guanylyltransferase n=1 Tax=Cryobacterium sp. Y11 TaxID=2045016 RepID=UPI000CE45064|nr:NTP transferase domain-containing protein [Cryobacterium sp. Y11]